MIFEDMLDAVSELAACGHRLLLLVRGGYMMKSSWAISLYVQGKAILDIRRFANIETGVF